MSKELEALEKLNHTICLNNNNETLKFGIDDLDHIDCDDVYEFIECYNIIKSALEQLEILMNKKVNIGYLKWLIERKDKPFKEKLANYNGREEELTKIEFTKLTKWIKKGGQMTNEKGKK